MKNPEQTMPSSTGSIVKISNGPCTLETLPEVAKKIINRAQRSPVGKLCIPVHVSVNGGAYAEAPDRNDLKPWDVVGEYSFSLYENKGRGKLAQHSIRYNLYGDGRMKRLKPVYRGDYLDEARNLVKKVVWVEDTLIHGVDAKVIRYVDQETGTEGTSLSFISVPKPGQWKDTDTSRESLNSKDEPIPFSKGVDIIF